MEYANGGTLNEYLYKNFTKMDWNLKLKFAKQISSAVFCLHSNNIIHRDLVSFSIHNKNFPCKNTNTLIILCSYINNCNNDKAFRKYFHSLR